MATYTLTPAERRARAQAYKEARENRLKYKEYLYEANKYKQELTKQQNIEDERRRDIESQSFLVRGLSTVGDVVANVITGAVKGLEGIVDLGIGLVGAVGGIFDGDFQDRVKNVISYDWTGETFGNALQEALKYSYTTNGGIIENVANGIGQMLPAVLVTVATAGAGAPAAIAQGASLATLGISAAGNSTESAFQEGADYWAGLGYGAASGLVEVATEKMFGGATKALTGAGIFDGITKSVADTGVRRIAKNALEEGVEEVVSELANPALKSIYKGKDALNEYGTVEYWKGVGEAGLVGSLTALAYSGSVGYGMSKLGVGYVGKEADIADSLSEIDSLKKKAINLQANDELFGVNEQKIADTTRKNYQNIEKTLKSVSEEKRANFIKKFDLGNAFNPDGTMSEKMSSWLNVEQIDTDNTNNSDSALASPKKDSYSFSLRGREAEIQNDLNRIREDLVKQYAQDKNASTEEAMQKVGELKVFSEEMSDKAKESRKKFNKGLNYLNKISGGDVAFVITEANDSFNGNLVDGRTIYIGEDTFENDSWSGTLVHEYTHFSEGSEEYNRLLNFLQSDDIVVADGIKLWEKGQNAVLNKNYGFDSNKIKSIKEKLDSGKPITQVEQRYYDNFATEVVAHETEYLLGNEEFIDRLVARESSLAQKVIKKIQNLSKMFNKVGDSQSKTQISQLKKAEKLYLKAASKAGEMRLVRMILSQDPELEREIDNSAEMQYNKKDKLIGKTFPSYSESFSEANELTTRWAKQSTIKEGWQKLVSFQDNWYLVEKFSDTDSGYQIVDKIDKEEYEKYANDIKAFEGEDYESSIDEGIRLYENGRAEQSIDSNEIENGRANSNISKMAQKRSSEESSGIEARRDSKQGGRNQQVKYLLKVGDENVEGLLEEEKNLVALHNLSEDKLSRVIDLGGFPMPSIAITTTDLPHDNYGDITVVFDKNTIDPEADERNVVYDRDAWTPTTPSVDVKLKNQEVDSLIDSLQKIVDDIPAYKNDINRFFDGKYRDNNGDYILSDSDFSRDTIGRKAFDNEGILAAYLKELGVEVEPVYREENFLLGWSSLTREQARKLLDSVGITKDITRDNITKEQRSEVLEKYIQYRAEERYNFIKKKKPDIDYKTIYNDIESNTDDGNVSQILFMAEEFYNEKRPKDVYDSYATRDKLQAEIKNKEDFYTWFWDKFSSTFEKKGIDNDSEVFDRRGNRRSFEQRHYAYNVNNIVKAMAKGEQEGKTTFGMTAGALAARLSKQFVSIEDIREAKNYLALVSEEDLKAFNDKTYELYDEVVSEIVGNSGDFMSNMTRRDDVGDILGKCASMKPLTIENIKRRFNNETKGYNLNYKFNDEVAGKALTLFESLKHIPTTYFEAKPRRAVGLNEIKAVIIPESASENLVKKLKEKNIPYQTYAGGDGERANIIKKMDNVRFSLKDSEGRTLTQEQQEFFKDSKIRDVNGNLLVVYHGTNSENFYVFDKNRIGDSSGDRGFFGEGFYFTINKGEAEYFGENIIESYLNIKNPYYFWEELFQYKNQNAQYDRNDYLIFITNFVDKFSDILPKWLHAYSFAVHKDFSLKELAKIYKDTFNNKQFDIKEVEGEFGKEYLFRSDKATKQYTNADGERFSFEEYGFEVRSLDKNLSQAELTSMYIIDKYQLQNIPNFKQIVLESDFSEKLKSLGYDGIMQSAEGDEIVAFEPNQIKKTNNLNPTLNEDIRYQLKDNKQYFYELSDGQIKKLLADKTKMKVYSKTETEATVNTILETSLGIGEKYGKLSGKSKAEVIEMLWRGLNTAEPGRQMHVALDVAEYIIQNSVLENIYDDGENEANYFVVSVLKPYLHSLDLSGIKSDISYHYDRDNSPYLLWGKRRGDSGTAPDQLKAILEEQGFYIDSDVGADIFFQIDSAYREAVNSLKKKTKEVLTSALSSEERKELKNKIAREVLLSFDTTGKPSKLSKILDEYHKEARFWREKYYNERTRNSVVNRLLDKVQKVKDIKLGTFLNASQYKTDIFKKSIESLAKIKFRGDLNQSGTRNIVEGLREWYVESNPLLEGVYDSTISEMLTDISTGEGQLTTQELRNLSNIVDYFKHFIETYNKVYRNGQYVEAQPIAEKYVGIIKKNQNVKVGWLKKFFESYLTTFGDPMAVARYMDKYESGFFSEMLSSLREAATNAQIDEMNIREPIDEFIKKNKKYFSEATKRTITYNGKEIPLLQGLYVYMALNDVDTLASFAESGFSYNDGKTEVRIDGFAVGEELDDVSLREKAKSIQGSLEKQFNVLDKEYIEIAKKIFNEECRKRYSETSILLKGYSNAKEGDYVPIRRANIAKNVDTSSLEYEINRASNASFTKDRVKGAKGELRVEGLNTVLDRHIRAISQYTNLAPSIEEYNKLFNLNTVDNHNKPVSVATESRLSWEKGDEYFRKLISDIQGIPTTKGDGIKAMSFIRGSYAKYQLGANPKVWITQLSSFFASGSVLDYSSIIKGLGIKTGDVDKYCQLAKLRNNDNTAAMAQGVIDDVGKVGNVLMKPIGAVDRFVVKKLFGACQIQVERSNGLKVGTEENKVKAGELLKKVILETQQNSMSTERSAAMRSGSEFMRTITMFSADSMKVVGRVIDSIGELTSLKAKKKLLTDVKEIDEIDKKIKSSIKKVAKSTTSLITSAVFMALVAQLFRTLYNKDDEDDNIIENMTVDAIGNLLGGLPIFKDVYARFAEGYDIDGYAYSAINDLLDSAVNIFDMVGDIFSGEVDSKEIAKNIKNMVYAGGQVFGLPTRNIYNISYGLTKRFSPSTAYKIDNVFYNKNYSSDLKKAIEREDDEMISTIVGIMLDEKVGGVNDSNVRKELNTLVSKGYSVLPRSVGNKISYDGEEVSLTNTQQEEFRRVYSVANEALASLVKLPQYESATDDIKAKAINYIYNVYYNLAIQDLLGVDLETKTILFAEALDVEKLAIIVSTANSLTADIDKKGNAISGSRKAKIQNYINSLKLTAVQKYMIMGYLGFKNTKGEVQVKAYINRLNLTKTEKDKLLKYSGYSD